MGRVWIVVLAVCASWAWGAVAQDRTKDLETVKARIMASARKEAPDLKRARAFVQSQKPDGSWEEVRYEAKDRMYWPPMEHLERLSVLAEAQESGKAPEDERAALAQAFVKGFDFWVTRDATSSNWWYNEIGAPASLYRLMLLTEPLLTGGRLDTGCKLLERSKLAMTGQNLVWLAENVIGRACLQRDPERMAAAFKRIEAEIVVTDKEGIQPDFSFHQHGAQLYSGGYGNGFASCVPRFALLAQGTAFAFAPEKIRILESYLLEGQQWMIRGGIFDYSASGREPTRPNSGKVGGYATNAKSLLKLGAVTRRAELEALAARIEKGVTEATPALVGHKHYWCSDYTVHHRPEWLVSVRLTSDRMLQTELVNEENQLGEHLSDGVTYLYRTGGEYRNIFPVWDWARLPGITVEQNRPLLRINNKRRGSRAFAGGCSDGVRGVSAMDFERDGLTAKKAWFFFEGEVVCLGADIGSANAYRVITSVNQCLADGPVTLKRAGGAAEVLASPVKIEKPLWAHHNGIGYVFLDAGESVGVGTSVQTGCWKRVSAVQKAAPVATPVFSVWVNHGKLPQAATYAYAVTVKQDAAAVNAYAAELPVRVVSNTPQAQAVEQTQAGVLQAAFYQAGTLSSETWGQVSVDAPCLLMLSKAEGKTRVTVCNPCNREGVIRIKVGERIAAAQLPAGDRAGASVSIEL
jgi:chondroitin AC lyase